jgi:hypothetical protein
VSSAASWLHEADCTPMANMPRATRTKRASQIKKHRRPSPRSAPKTSAVEKTAVRISGKFYEATGGRPQRWESLGNLGVVNADAAGIAYAIERDWLVVSGGLHSVSLTEDGRRRVK